MQQLEVFVGDRIFIALAQKADVVGIFQVFDSRREAPCLLDVALDRSRVLHSAMNHFFFAIAADLKRNGGRRHGCGDRQQSHKQHEHEQDVTALGPAACTNKAAIMKLLRHGSMSFFLTTEDRRPKTVLLSLCQRNTLTIIIQHIFHFHRYRRDVQNPVAAIDDVAFACNENILTLRQEDLFWFARLVGKSKKLEIDRRRRWRTLWNYGRRGHMHRNHRLRNIDLPPGKRCGPRPDTWCLRWPSASHSGESGPENFGAHAGPSTCAPATDISDTPRAESLLRWWEICRCRRVGKNELPRRSAPAPSG